MRVKICGITSANDARLVDREGADAIGMNFIESSKRFVTLQQARAIASAAGPFITTVGIFRNQPLDEVQQLARSLRLHAIQLHGDEDADYAAQLAGEFTLIKALSFSPALDPDALRSYPADAILLDGIKPGSGETFQWSDALGLKGMPGLILAGGLTPGNVAEGIKVLSPYAVDVASGVEAGPGVKDPDKLRDFIRRARSAGK